jgi:ABC-type Zn uptake system ZnuABC Zn-binding protein ZnuA
MTTTMMVMLKERKMITTTTIMMVMLKERKMIMTHALDMKAMRHGEFDPHIWLDPINAKAMLNEMVDI